MAAQGWVCVQCDREQATTYCLCSSDSVFLCDSCVSLHYGKFPSRLHILVPTYAFGEHKIPGYFDRLQERLKQLPTRVDHLRKESTAMKQCYQDYSDMVNALIAAITETANRVKDKLTKTIEVLERDIADGIAEAENTVYQNQPELKNKWAQLLRYAGDERMQIKAFEYNIDTQSVLSSIASMLTYTSCLDFTEMNRQEIPCISGQLLRVVNPVSETQRKGLLSIHFTDGAVCAWLNDQSVLCVGGRPASAQVHTINSSTFRITAKHQMCVSRSYPGLLVTSAGVYVFGGWKPGLRSCESFDVYKDSWRTCGQMSDPRSCFTPCRHSSDVFLFDSSAPRKELEIFNLVTERFRPVYINLSELSHYCVSFLSDEKFVIVTKRQKVCLLLSNLAEATIASVCDSRIRLPSVAAPITVKESVFVVDSGSGNLFEFKGDCNEWTTIVTKEET